ncbi:Lipoxygenase [Thozetella sp. PMI_491]|nr:Lipoxygenase [Thozetella sp. PMI_491]
MDLNPEILLAVADLTKATLDFYKYNGLKTLDDYTRLYNGEWTGTVPGGPELGIETNYTQDLLFSMQRLSSSPYKIRRLNPNSDQLQFSVDDSIAVNITGQTLQSLLQQGRLFYADYRDQKNLTASGKYAAACDAYFYIDQGSGDFLPLAIRTNAGAPLIYTPLDSKNDWLLAKIMYNVDDFWFAQWNHLASTHEVVQIVWMAAIRTLSYRHPIFAVLNRRKLSHSTRERACILFIPGGAVDLVFPYTGQSAQDFATNRYKYGGAGRFQSNYFTSDLTKRGLINSPIGPSLKHFPFYEDAGTIYTAILNFMKRLVYTFYASDAELIADSEIQAWVAECNGPAQVIDFPAKITDRPTLVYVLTHLAHLVSSAHHTVNTNELLKVSSTLPFCPPALYKAPPTTKNANTNLATFLPPLTKVLQQFSVGALFARPLLAGTNRTIMHMFDDRVMLARMPVAMSIANKLFMDSMQQFSSQVSSRGFDSTGLSQGMPFVWKALDPNVAPYYIAT